MSICRVWFSTLGMHMELRLGQTFVFATNSGLRRHRQRRKSTGTERPNNCDFFFFCGLFFFCVLIIITWPRLTYRQRIRWVEQPKTTRWRSMFGVRFISGIQEEFLQQRLYLRKKVRLFTSPSRTARTSYKRPAEILCGDVWENYPRRRASSMLDSCLLRT